MFKKEEEDLRMNGNENNVGNLSLGQLVFSLYRKCSVTRDDVSDYSRILSYKNSRGEPPNQQLNILGLDEYFFESANWQRIKVFYEELERREQSYKQGREGRKNGQSVKNSLEVYPENTLLKK